MTFRLGDRDVTIEDCRRYVGLYNAGYYAPARKSNVEADQEAYSLFANGLCRDVSSLIRQLVFIGKDFGGAKVIPFERMSRTIAERILVIGSDYFDMLSKHSSMEAEPVTEQAVNQLLSPFVKLPPEVGRKRNFPVWASKVLHFARLDTFPILDSAAIRALGLQSSITYSSYARMYRPVFVSALGDLRQLNADDPMSPTLLRRFDKILYQFGLELKNRTSCG